MPSLSRSDSLPDPREPRSGHAVRRLRALGVVAVGLGCGLMVALTLVSDPVALSRLAARVQAHRAGAEFLGRGNVTLQSGLHDCGPAALANLLLRLGVDPPPLDSLGRLAGTGPTGTRVSGLVGAGVVLGVPLRRWAGVPDPAASLPLPSIAWVRESHFVTLAARRPDGRLSVLDPLVGRYAMSTADFHRIWSGGLLLVPEEIPPLVATSVAALLPLAGGIHAKSPLGPAHPLPGRRIRHPSGSSPS